MCRKRARIFSIYGDICQLNIVWWILPLFNGPFSWNRRIPLPFYKMKIRYSPISDICSCLTPLCLWCPLSRISKTKKEEVERKIQNIFHMVPPTSKKKIVQSSSKWFTFCCTFFFEVGNGSDEFSFVWRFARVLSCQTEKRWARLPSELEYRNTIKTLDKIWY